MLCPDVCNFPPPKIISSTKRNIDLNEVTKTINMNQFYKSVVVTFPDEIQTPTCVEEVFTLDTDFYKIYKCSLTLLLEQAFVDTFVKNGKLYCLTTGKDSIIDNCVAITPDGTLRIHVPEYRYQCLGLEGSKSSLGFHEIKIDLKNLTQRKIAADRLSKLEELDFFISWESDDEDVCPSTIAKYFFEQGIKVSVENQKLRILTPNLTSVPSLDAEPSELSEWIGMLAIGGDLNPSHDYISSYSEPESDHPLPTSRISVLIATGFFTPSLLNNLCTKVSENVIKRDLEHYWAAVSIQSFTDSPWRWNYGTPQVFQAHDSSTSIFFSKDSNVSYSVGEIKIS